MTTKLFNAIKVSILAIVLSFGLSYALAWTAPTATPPTGNVSAPINTSATLQQKSGDLTVKNFMADMVNIGLPLNPNAITAPKFCIGVSCITAWPAVGGGGTVTSLSAGTGIALSPNPITTTGTISANTAVVQSRVTGSCAVGQAITAINADGTVTCGAAGSFATATSRVVTQTWGGLSIIGSRYVNCAADEAITSCTDEPYKCNTRSAISGKSCGSASWNCQVGAGNAQPSLTIIATCVK